MHAIAFSPPWSDPYKNKVIAPCAPAAALPCTPYLLFNVAAARSKTELRPLVISSFRRPGAILEQASTITGTTTPSCTFTAHRCPLVAGTTPATRTASSSQLLSSVALAKSGHPRRRSSPPIPRRRHREDPDAEPCSANSFTAPDTPNRTRSLKFRAPVCRHHHPLQNPFASFIFFHPLVSTP